MPGLLKARAAGLTLAGLLVASLTAPLPAQQAPAGNQAAPAGNDAAPAIPIAQ
jgi:hypothetical protein